MIIDTPGNITKQFKKQLFAIRSNDMYNLLFDLRNYDNMHSINAFGQYLHYTDKEELLGTDTIFEFLKRKKHKNIEIKPIQATIEDCFIELMSKEKNQHSIV